MTVELLHNTPLWVASTAIRKCWASEGKSDSEKHYDVVDGMYIGTTCGPKDKELIHRVGNKFKHASTLEHLVYTFDIDGISRACLQELARHRMASYSVKSTRYTLKELKQEELWYYTEIQGGQTLVFDDEVISKYVVLTGDTMVDAEIKRSLKALQDKTKDGISNDIAKYCLPEAYKTSLVMTVNARSLQNFLALRTSKSALWEIQSLAKAMYEQIPEEHKYLFKECINDAKEGSV